ncbi:MAG: COX15/CtaA family protein, partial [Comamonas sp.]
TLHLLGGTVLLMLLTVQATRHTQFADNLGLVPVPRLLRGMVMVTALLVFAQVTLGGWVSTNYAVLACTTFPTCQGSWWPAMDFAQAFEIWRPLGMLQDGRHLDFEALTAIHYLHRLAAYVVAAALVALFLALRRAQALARQRRWLAGLLLLQVMTGLSNVLFDWPLIAAVLHTGGAAALVGVLVWSLAASSSSSRADMDRRRLLSKKAIARA